MKSDDAPPFGWNLFQGQFGTDHHTSLNPDYRVMPGDEITVSIWGAVNFNEKIMVDNQGNLFLPDIGPIPVRGIHYSGLTAHVKKYLSSQYKGNVNLYINLIGTQMISVFVTGAVPSPGRFSGEANYSVLHYIDMAQGILPDSGSFRKIDIIRSDGIIASIDLYEFLLRGELPKIQLHDGDTIFVHTRGLSVMADGAARNALRFEFTTEHVRGKALIDLAMPLPEATHALVSGTRGSSPFSSYMTLSDFEDAVLLDGDRIGFRAGVPDEKLQLTITGQHKGPRTMIVPENATLLEVLRQIEVDPGLADTGAVYIRRASVSRKQKEALKESLQRLEASVLTTDAVSEEDARIRAQQISMVQSFVAKAQDIKPEGRMVVSTGEAGLRNILLENQDEIVIPRKSNLVHVNGEILMPRAVVFQPGENTDYYVQRAGGYSQRADTDRVVIIRANGEALLSSKAEILAGDEILVMPEIPSNLLQVSKDIADILYKIAITAIIPFRF